MHHIFITGSYSKQEKNWTNELCKYKLTYSCSIDSLCYEGLSQNSSYKKKKEKKHFISLLLAPVDT